MPSQGGGIPRVLLVNLVPIWCEVGVGSEGVGGERNHEEMQWEAQSSAAPSSRPPPSAQ